jgi:hypothetical protein
MRQKLRAATCYPKKKEPLRHRLNGKKIVSAQIAIDHEHTETGNMVYKMIAEGKRCRIFFKRHWLISSHVHDKTKEAVEARSTPDFFLWRGITNTSSQKRPVHICVQVLGHLPPHIMSPTASDKARLQIQKRQEKARRHKHALAQEKYREKLVYLFWPQGHTYDGFDLHSGISRGCASRHV